ncbi:MAG: TraR/DksA family transcriptional regulator, partial [Candidatus Rokuibacteriota bacterium]
MRDTRTERRLLRELDFIVTRLDGHTRAAAREGRPGGEGFAGDLVEDAQVVEAQALSDLSYGRLARRARTIRDALVRLQDGLYGRCEECGRVIAPARLRALPDVTTCLRCQETAERTRAAG